MAGSLLGFVSAARAAFRARAALVAEAIVLRHQVAVLQRSGTRRPRFHASDRLFWALLSRWWSGWRKHLVIVQPATVLRWRRQGLSLIWGYRSRGRWRGGRPRIAREIRGLIAAMARDNFLWGAPRIHGELLKLGFSVSQATASRYMPDPRWRRSQSWRTFIRNQAAGIGLSELTGGRSVSDFIEAKARSWLRVVARRIVGFISDRFANCSQQPAWPRALSERRRNGPMSIWATAGAAWAATSSITRRGAELQTAKRPRKSMAGARAPPYHVRASPLRRPTGYARLSSVQIYAAMSDRLTTNATNCRRWTPPVQLQFHAKPFGPSFEDRQDDLSQTISEMRELGARRRGRVVLACLPSIAARLVGPALKDFQSRHPGISVKIFDGDATSVASRVRTRDADFGIGSTPDSDHEIEFTPLLRDRCCVVCSINHPLASAAEVRLKDLAAYPFLALGRTTGARRILDQVLAKADIHLNIICELGQLSTLCGMIETGVGVSILPEASLPTIGRGGILARKLVDPVVERELGLLTIKGRRLSPAADSFRALLLKNLPRVWRHFTAEGYVGSRTAKPVALRPKVSQHRSSR